MKCNNKYFYYDFLKYSFYMLSKFYIQAVKIFILL